MPGKSSRTTTHQGTKLCKATQGVSRDISARPILTYYRTNQRDINQPARCLGEELKLINLRIDEGDEDKIRKMVAAWY